MQSNKANSDVDSVTTKITTSTAKKSVSGSEKKRKWAPKVRTGCLTCRARRIKCDEAYPICRKCVVGGRKCRSFLDSTREGEPPSPMPLPDTLVRQPNHGPTPLYAQSSPDARRIFYTFRIDVLPLITGSMDREFWTGDVLRASQTHPALWHAVLALTAIYASIRHNASSHQELSLRHCNSSIRHVLQISSTPSLTRLDKEIILLTTVLLTGLCSLRRDLRQAVAMARHGLKLLHEWDFLGECQDTGGSILSSKFLSVQLQRAQAHYLWPGIESDRVAWLAPSVSLTSVSSASFSCATEAMVELQPLIIGAAEAVRSDRMYEGSEVAPRPDPRLPYRAAFAAWKKKFAELKIGNDLAADRRSVLILEVWAICVELLLLMDIWQSGVGYDDYVVLFERLNNVAEEVIEEDEERAESGRTTPFSFEMSLSEPLFVVALACRVSSISQRAISLMKRWSRIEGMWSSEFFAAVAQVARAAEDSALPALATSACPCVQGRFVCGRHRVFSTLITFVDDGLARININSIEGFLGKGPGATYYVRY